MPLFIKLAISVATALIACAGTAAAASPPGALVFPPVDEASRDPGFLAFRENILALTHARDADAVASHAHADIKLSFGGAYGRATFHQLLSENASHGGASYWQELSRTLELGGVFMGPDIFCTPYISCLAIPECGSCDPYETLIAVEANAPIHAAPDAASEIVATVSHAVVSVIDTAHYPWSRVRLSAAASDPPLEGYVTAPAFRSPIDYRARFERQLDGAWSMTLFIAGD